MRTKRSLRLFQDAWGALKALVEGLARLGILPLPPALDRAEEEPAGFKNGSKNGVKGAAAAARGKGSGRRRQRTRGGWVLLSFCLAWVRAHLIDPPLHLASVAGRCL